MAAGRRRNRGMLFVLLGLLLIVIIAAVFILTGGLPSAGTPAEDAVQTEAAAVATSTPAPDMVPIVVLAQPVDRGIEITEDMIALIPYPLMQMEQGLFITNVDEVLGKRALYELDARIPLTPNLLTSTEESSIASFNIPAGRVAITIPADRLSTVAYALEAGDHVNLIASMFFVDLDTDWQTELPNIVALLNSPMEMVETTGEGDTETAPTSTSTITSVPLTISVVPPYYEIPYAGRIELDQNLAGIEGTEFTLDPWMYILPSERSQRPRLVSQTLIQDAIVLWVGEYAPKEEKEEELPAEEAAGPVAPTPTPAVVVQQEPTTVEEVVIVRPDVVTLIVEPQDAVTINYLMIMGADLNLVLRSAGDDSRIQAETVTLQFILEQYNIPIPSKLPYGMAPRTDTFVNVTIPTATPTPIVVSE